MEKDFRSIWMNIGKVSFILVLDGSRIFANTDFCFVFISGP